MNIEKLQKLIKWAEVKKQDYSAMYKVMETEKMKYTAHGHVEELRFFIQQLNEILSEELEK